MKTKLLHVKNVRTGTNKQQQQPKILPTMGVNTRTVGSSYLCVYAPYFRPEWYATGSRRTRRTERTIMKNRKNTKNTEQNKNEKKQAGRISYPAQNEKPSKEVAPSSGIRENGQTIRYKWWEKKETKGKRLKLSLNFIYELHKLSFWCVFVALTRKRARFCELLSFFLSIYFVCVTHHAPQEIWRVYSYLFYRSHTPRTPVYSIPSPLPPPLLRPIFPSCPYLPFTMKLFRKSLAALLGCALLSTTALVADAGLVSQVAVLTFAGWVLCAVPVSSPRGLFKYLFRLLCWFGLLPPLPPSCEQKQKQ